MSQRPLILLASALVLGPALASAQPGPTPYTVGQASVVSSCGSASYSAGQAAPVTQDLTGKGCANTGVTNLGGYSFQLAPAITVQNAAYAAGNSEGGLITVTGAARTAGGTGALVSGRLKSTGGSTNSLWVYAWSKSPSSTCTDKTAFVSNAADGPYAIPGFPMSVTLGGSPGSFDLSTYAQMPGLNTVFKNQDSSPGTAIYVCLVTAAAVTPAATTDLSIVLTGFQD